MNQDLYTLAEKSALWDVFCKQFNLGVIDIEGASSLNMVVDFLQSRSEYLFIRTTNENLLDNMCEGV